MTIEVYMYCHFILDQHSGSRISNTLTKVDGDSYSSCGLLQYFTVCAKTTATLNGHRDFSLDVLQFLRNLSSGNVKVFQYLLALLVKLILATLPPAAESEGAD